MVSAGAASVTSAVATLTVVCPQIVLGPPSLPDMVLEAPAFSTNINVSGGAGSYSFSVSSGSLPSGLNLATDSGALFGIPSALGTSIYTITATDTNGCTGSQTYTQTVFCPQIVLSPSSLPVGLVGSNYNQAITNTTPGSGLSPFKYSVTQGSLPPGLTLASGGTLSGTMTAAGVFNFTVAATNAAGCVGNNAYTLTVQDLTPPTIACPANLTVNAAAGFCYASGVALGTPTTSDNSGTVTVTSNAPVQFPVGTNYVAWTATDPSGNTNTCTQMVVVRDISPPTIVQCATNRTVAANGSGQAALPNLAAQVLATDCSGSVIVTQAPPAGTLVGLGATTVTLYARDPENNLSTCAATVTVVSNTLPAITMQPQSQTVAAGSNATFSVSATGTPPLAYQWLRNAAVIASATGSSYTLASAGFANVGGYSVIVSNASGVVTSSVAPLYIVGSASAYAWTNFVGQPGGLGNVDGTGNAARFQFPRGSAVDGAGNVFVADYQNQTIRKVTPAGVVTTLAGRAGLAGTADGTGSAARFSSPSGVAVDGAGNICVADYNNNTIRKVTAAGVVTTLAGGAGLSGSIDGTGSAARFNRPSGVAMDSTGNVFVADQQNHTIRKVTPAGVVTTLAGLAGNTGTADGTGGAARFNYPTGVALDSTGGVFVADQYNHTIRKITPAGVVTTLAGSAGLSGSTDGTGSVARFNYPTGVAVDSAGTVFVADFYNSTIRKVTSAGVVTTLAGSGALGSTDGTGSTAQFYGPFAVALDGAGNLFVADSGNSTIRTVTSAGVVTTLAGSAGAFGSADGTGSAAQFLGPQGSAVDGAGNVYVADSYNYTIRKITPAGVTTTLAGLAGSSGSADGTGSAARFYYPRGVAVDSAGNLYVADNYNSTIRKVTSGGVVTTLAGTAGVAGRADGTGSAARFSGPSGVALDAAGNLYVADTYNHTIRKVTPGGVVTTLAGSAGLSGSGDGTGSAARFNQPSGVAVDSAGNIFVADQNNHTIRQVTQAGVVTTIGSVAGVIGGADGIGPSANFSSPAGVAADNVGNLYTADNGNHRITKGTPVYMPGISTQPVSQTVITPSSVSFTVGAASGGPTGYQWFYNGAAVAGGTDSTLTLTSTTMGSAGDYQVVVTNVYGSVTSAAATLTMICPQIILNPATLPAVALGSAYNQTITATGSMLSLFSYSVTQGALPPGITLAAGGALSGTPTAAGVFNFAVTATDVSGCAGTNAYTVTVVGPPSISQPPRVVSGNFVVHFAGVSNVTYAIEVRTCLRGSWQNFTSITASPAGDILFSTPVNAAPMSFFRAVPVP